MLTPVDEIKSKLDLVDIIQDYFPLKQAGANFKAVCPFHDEKTPSFMVSREKQIFHCFGCNKGGDMFTFIQEMEKVEFPEALKILANKAGVKLQYQDPKVMNLKTRLVAMQEVASDWFQGQLRNSESGKKALRYLKEERKLQDETIREWGIGYALDSWDALGNYLKSKQFSEQEIVQGGLVVPKDRGGYYDRFRDRIMFTIEDHHGNIVGFTGRAIKKEESAKYVNSPQTLVYNKSEVIFGLGKAKQYIKEKDAVVLVEGNMDVIASYQAGVKNVVAVSGTALTSEQVKMLKRYTNNFIFSFDADTAGVGAAKRGIEMAWGQEVNVKVAAIPDEIGKDPDDLVRKDPGIWRELVEEKCVPAMEYFFEIEFKKYNADDINSKKEVAKNLLNLILKLSNPIEADFYLKKLADKLKVEEGVLRETVKQARNKIRTPAGAKTEKDEKKNGVKTDNRAMILQRLLGFMLISGDYADYAGQKLEIESIISDYQDIYKTIIIYYTKFNRSEWSTEGLIKFVQSVRPDLADLFNPLLLLAEEELGKMDYKRAIEEVKRIVGYIKKEEVKRKLNIVNMELKQAEKELAAGVFVSEEDGKQVRGKVDELLTQFKELAKELKEVENL